MKHFNFLFWQKIKLQKRRPQGAKNMTGPTNKRSIKARINDYMSHHVVGQIKKFPNYFLGKFQQQHYLYIYIYIYIYISDEGDLNLDIFIGHKRKYYFSLKKKKKKEKEMLFDHSPNHSIISIHLFPCNYISLFKVKLANSSTF